MAEIRTGEFSRWRNDLVDAHQSLKINLWDCGPERPTRPAKPVVSQAARSGSVEYDLEQIELRSAVENYEKTLAIYLANLLLDRPGWREVVDWLAPF
jgi:hypothetical protein